MCVGQYGLWQTHHLTVRGVGRQDVRTYSTDVLGQRHHQFLADGVDSRIGDLCKLLTEIVEEHLRTVANHSQRGVVTHCSHRFLSGSGHRNDGLVDIFLSVAKHHQFGLQVTHAVVYLTSTFQHLQLNAVLREPLPIRMSLSQLFLNLAVVVYLALLGVDEQNLAWLQSTFLHHIARFKVHHAHFAGHHHQPLLGDGVAAGAQTVSVEHSPRITTVAEEQRCRTVPRFHQNGVVLVERLQVFRDGVLVVKTLRDKNGHCLRKRESTHHEELEHVVE